MIKAPPRIADAARNRISEAIKEIQHSVAVIADGRPGDAETEVARREQVFQARTGSSLEEARRRISRVGVGQERVFGRTIDFVDVAFFEWGLRAARAVARIITRDGFGFGTGFMISPRLLMTNNHVIGDAAVSGDLLAEFDYERDIMGRPRKVSRFAFAPEVCFLTNHEDNLDYTVIAIGDRVAGEGSLSQFGFLPISNARNKHQLGDYVNIIQHPDGRPKEAVLRENQLVARVRTTLHYLADTEPGSSGSPVLNVQFALVALHHWGTPHRELLDENGKPIPKAVNEGIRASSIHSDLATLRSALNPVAREAIDEALQLGLEGIYPAPFVPSPEFNPPIAPHGSGGQLAEMSSDGTATWSIPLTVSVRIGAAQNSASTIKTAAANRTEQTAAVENDDERERKIEVDPDYADRPGYDPNFLEGFEIPLPQLSASQRRIAAKNKIAASGDNPYELKYYHYSVMMNGKRRLAFVSAVNINGAEAKDYNRQKGTITDPYRDDDSDEREASELWFTDPRIEKDQQTPRNFYQGQTAFDEYGAPVVDKKTGGHHLNRMFQQGHLTRRQDPIWGDDAA